jgi:hypothetical protein
LAFRFSSASWFGIRHGQTAAGCAYGCAETGKIQLIRERFSCAVLLSIRRVVYRKTTAPLGTGRESESARVPTVSRAGTGCRLVPGGMAILAMLQMSKHQARNNAAPAEKAENLREPRSYCPSHESPHRRHR